MGPRLEIQTIQKTTGIRDSRFTRAEGEVGKGEQIIHKMARGDSFVFGWVGVEWASHNCAKTKMVMMMMMTMMIFDHADDAIDVVFGVRVKWGWGQTFH